MNASIKVTLSIRAGDKTPAWLFDPPTNRGAGATPLTFSYSPKDGTQSTNCGAWLRSGLGFSPELAHVGGSCSLFATSMPPGAQAGDR